LSHSISFCNLHDQVYSSNKRKIWNPFFLLAITLTSGLGRIISEGWGALAGSWHSWYPCSWLPAGWHVLITHHWVLRAKGTRQQCPPRANGDGALRAQGRQCHSPARTPLKPVDSKPEQSHRDWCILQSGPG
jgi:hypothetical protein